MCNRLHDVHIDSVSTQGVILMIEFFQNNYEWVFSGLGSSIIFWFIGYKQGYSKAINQQMKVGDGSTGVQVGGSMTGNIGTNE